MNRTQSWLATVHTNLTLALRALRAWDGRRIGVAMSTSLAVGVFLGVATVLIPNTVFMRDIAPVWWNYPVWVATSIATGMLIASYVPPRATLQSPGTAAISERDADGRPSETPASAALERTTGRFALSGGALAWFAIGCPVCNKVALLALGYTGALTWFAPLQPVLALAALAFSAVALVFRLRGEVACPVRAARTAVVA